MAFRWPLVAVVVVGVLAGASDLTEAAGRRSAKSADGYEWVTATSAYYGAARSISAPTRPSKWGREVRLPGGSWIDCAGDCRDKLRESTIDFWEEQNNRGSEPREP
ncbi:MAG TPA: hypothetical protein VNK52_12560 [Hyphomicrobiaceae bacterium]|nr:hypothetical protein [Hyphomicrobiaceae bacterium]